MHKRIYAEGKAKGWKLFLLCLALSAGLIILLSVVATLVLIRLNDPTAVLGISSLAVMMLSAALAGLICHVIHKEAGVKFGLLVGLTTTLIMLLINVIISMGHVSLGSFMNYGCYLGIYGLAVYLAKGSGGRRRRRK